MRKKVYKLDEFKQECEHWKETQERECRRSTTVKARTKNQQIYLDSMLKNQVTVVTGPAGTGKTYVAAGVAAHLFYQSVIDKIIVTRPLVECGHKMGAFPGSPAEKAEPYMRPVIDDLMEFFGRDYHKFVQENKIQIVPLELMRGSSLKRTFILCDESQNATSKQLRMLVTRFDVGSKIVIAGDVLQADLTVGNLNPLEDMVNRFSFQCHKNVFITKLTYEDCQRPEVVQWMDFRMSDQYDPTGTKNEQWFDTDCPSCKISLNYEDSNEDLDQIICYSCNKRIELLDANGNYVSSIAKTKKEKCGNSYPQRP